MDLPRPGRRLNTKKAQDLSEVTVEWLSKFYSRGYPLFHLLIRTQVRSPSPPPSPLLLVLECRSPAREKKRERAGISSATKRANKEKTVKSQLRLCFRTTTSVALQVTAMPSHRSAGDPARNSYVVIFWRVRISRLSSALSTDRGVDNLIRVSPIRGRQSRARAREKIGLCGIIKGMSVFLRSSDGSLRPCSSRHCRRRRRSDAQLLFRGRENR